MSLRTAAPSALPTRGPRPWLRHERFADLPNAYRIYLILHIGAVAVGCAIAAPRADPALAAIIAAAVFMSYGLAPMAPGPTGGVVVFDTPTRYSVALLFDPATALIGIAAGVGMGGWLVHKREAWRVMVGAATFALGPAVAALAVRWLIGRMGLTFAMVIAPAAVVVVAHLVNDVLIAFRTSARYGLAAWPEFKTWLAAHAGDNVLDILFLLPVAVGAVLIAPRWWPVLLVVSIVMSRLNAWYMLSQLTRSGVGPTTLAAHAVPGDDPLLKRIAEEIGQGVGLVTPDGVLVAMTAAGRRAFGRDELRADTNLLDLCSPLDASGIERAIAQSCRSIAEVAVDVRPADGTEPPRWVRLRFVNRLNDLAVRGIIVTIRSVADDAAMSHRLRDHVDHALAGQIIAAQEQERTRMSRELEDNVGQVLTVARSLLEQVQHAARVLQRGLRPPALDDLGLVEALRAYCAELGHADTEVVVDSNLAPGQRFPGDVEVTAYRIVHEALTALLPVSGPARATVSITLRGTALVIALEGRRNSPHSRPLNRGSLLILQERAELVGGRVATEPLDDDAVRIVVELPASERS